MPAPPITDLINGVDLLFHEATFLHELIEQAAVSMHTTAQQAAEIAKAGGVGQLIIGHFSSRYGNLQPLLEEARATFPNTMLAEEGKTFEVAYGARGDG